MMIKIIFIFFLSIMTTYAYSYSADGVLLIITNNSDNEVTYSLTGHYMFDVDGQINDHGISIDFIKHVLETKKAAGFNPYTIKPMTLGTIYTFGAHDFIIPPQSKLALIGRADRDSVLGGSGLLHGLDDITLNFKLSPLSDDIKIFRKANGDWKIKCDYPTCKKYAYIDFDNNVDHSGEVAEVNLNITKDNIIEVKNISPRDDNDNNNIFTAPYNSIIKNPIEKKDSIDNYNNTNYFNCIPRTHNQQTG